MVRIAGAIGIEIVTKQQPPGRYRDQPMGEGNGEIVDHRIVPGQAEIRQLVLKQMRLMAR